MSVYSGLTHGRHSMRSGCPGKQDGGVSSFNERLTCAGDPEKPSQVLAFRRADGASRLGAPFEG